MIFSHRLRGFLLLLFLTASAAYGVDDYYAILGVARDADANTIDHAYSLRLNENPDGLPDSLRVAYLTLSDPTKKRAYDRQLADQERRQRSDETLHRVRSSIGVVRGEQLVDQIVDGALATDRRKSRAYFAQVVADYHAVLSELMARDASAKARVMSFGGAPGFLRSIFSAAARCRWVMYRGLKGRIRELEAQPPEPGWRHDLDEAAHQAK